MTYQVVTNADLSELTEDVNKALKDGWQLQGGINTSAVIDNTYLPVGKVFVIYSQAIIKDSQAAWKALYGRKTEQP